MNNILKNKTFLIVYGLWGGLGSFRGIQDYNKTIDLQYKKYLKDPTIYVKPQFYYLSCFGISMFHSLLYIYPLSAPFCLLSEMYEIEKLIRNISDESD